MGRPPAKKSSLPPYPPAPLHPIKTVKRKVAKVSNKQKINVERFSVKNSRSLSQFGQWLRLSLSFSLCVRRLTACLGGVAAGLHAVTTAHAAGISNEEWLGLTRAASHRIASRRLELTLMPPNQSRDKGGRLKCGYIPGKQRQHCIDVGHVALGFFSPLSQRFSNLTVAVCLSSEKCRAGSFCIFLHCALGCLARFHWFVHSFAYSFTHSFIHSFLHSFIQSLPQSSVLFGFRFGLDFAFSSALPGSIFISFSFPFRWRRHAAEL